MIKATEALGLSESSSTLQTELKSIEADIKKAAKAGERSVMRYVAISDYAVRELRENGYEVSSDYDQRENGWLVKIKW